MPPAPRLPALAALAALLVGLAASAHAGEPGRTVVGLVGEGGTGAARDLRERFASALLHSVAIVTRGDDGRSWTRPVTFDLRSGRFVGWAELLGDAGPGGPRALAVRRALSGGCAGEDPGEEPPPFTLVPSRTPGLVAGLTLHRGERGGGGVASGREAYLSAAAILPYLAEDYRGLFGGEPEAAAMSAAPCGVEARGD